MLGTRDVLIAEEQHFVLQQQGANFLGQALVAGRIAEVDAGNLSADAAGQLFDFHGLLLSTRQGLDAGRRRLMEKFSAQQQPQGLTKRVSLLPSWVGARKTLGRARVVMKWTHLRAEPSYLSRSTGIH
ncbi:hypothetical protein SDC9_179365 [bioreactor metagenome]|uniref:Uncharacterized protein n=1 Tax=bioreactor metagenome TaxID=1076179 RepID=A0A645GZQ4_9ZZZZ